MVEARKMWTMEYYGDLDEDYQSIIENVLAIHTHAADIHSIMLSCDEETPHCDVWVEWERIPMTLQDAVEIIRKMQAEGDALEKQGIAKDWVCVIHPVLYEHLLNLIPQDAGIIARIGGIEQFTRRKTYVESRTEMTEVRYMPEETYQAIYHSKGAEELLEKMWQEYRDKQLLDWHRYGEPYRWDYTKGRYNK